MDRRSALNFLVGRNPKQVLLAGASVALCVALIFAASYFLKPQVVEVDNDVVSTGVVPSYEGDLSEPALRTGDVMLWAANVATDTMSFSFKDNSDRLQEVSRHFTPKGWERFIDSLKKSGLIENLKTNQMSVAPVQNGPPTLRSEGVVNNRYQWAVDVPIMITYQAGDKTRSQNMLVTVFVVRTPPSQGADGIAIDRWVAVPR